MSEIISEINKKYEGLIKSYQSLTDRYKILETDFHNSIKDRDIALSKSNPVLEEKYDKLKRDYNSVVNERNSANSKYSHIQRIHETCKLQQQECESRNNLLQAQMKQEEKHSNILKAKNDALKIEYDIMKDKFENVSKSYDICANLNFEQNKLLLERRDILDERIAYGKSMDIKLLAYREDNARLERDIRNKDKDYKNLKTVYDQLGKNNDDLRKRLKLFIDLKPTLKSIFLPVFALLVVGILPRLLLNRLQ